jgi:hypothetical protein
MEKIWFMITSYFVDISFIMGYFLNLKHELFKYSFHKEILL